MKLVIHTQHRENYGAHDWDGEGACPQYWKFKGGNTYVVENITDEQAIKIGTDGISNLTRLIESSSDSFQEYITMFLTVDDHATPWEEWDEPVQLVYSEGKWHAVELSEGRYSGLRKECLAQRKTWTLAEGGEQEGFKCEIQLAEGWFSWAEACERLSKMDEAA